jgi:hypothetical protein
VLTKQGREQERAYRDGTGIRVLWARNDFKQISTPVDPVPRQQRVFRSKPSGIYISQWWCPQLPEGQNLQPTAHSNKDWMPVFECHSPASVVRIEF